MATVRFPPIADIQPECFKARMTSDDLCNAIHEQIGSLRSGSLSFWGHWFGRPCDNVHRIVGADSLDDIAIIYFNHGESLIIEAPCDWRLEDGRLLVRDATSVRFQWFSYGQVPSRETLKVNAYRRVNGRLTFAADFHQGDPPELDRTAPAVELHALP